jgi:hypothetical protein
MLLEGNLSHGEIRSSSKNHGLVAKATTTAAVAAYSYNGSHE